MMSEDVGTAGMVRGSSLSFSTPKKLSLTNEPPPEETPSQPKNPRPQRVSFMASDLKGVP
jgi:hypothetical protein